MSEEQKAGWGKGKSDRRVGKITAILRYISKKIFMS